MIHDTETCNCEMCVWADETEKHHAAEKAAEAERMVINAS